MSTQRDRLLAGIKAQTPILLGTMPFGVIYGIAAMEAGLSPATAIGMSMIVFAGASQFIAAQLFAAGAPGLIIVLTTFIVNLRHMLYSASLAPYLRHLRRAWKYALAFLMTDETYAIAITNYRRHTPEAVRNTDEHWYTLGAGLTLWTTWQASTIFGVVVGTSIPASWSLDFTLALTFIALMIPTLTDAPAIAAALVAGLIGVLANGLPYNLGLVLAVLAGIGAGLVGEQIASATGQPLKHRESAQ
ncbi:MAG: AzlC family ABC transporter permease [Anaerolineae bacterium]